VSPARIEANRRNAQKSTGSRTARGKVQLRVNGLQKRILFSTNEATKCMKTNKTQAKCHAKCRTFMSK